MNGYYPLVIEQLRLHGFAYRRQGKGSHEIWGSGGVNVAVPRNLPSRHTANAIMRQAGINHHF
jgi:predicted RNA binding protein YcfA (HicA-like mRNA interferase family)